MMNDGKMMMMMMMMMMIYGRGDVQFNVGSEPQCGSGIFHIYKAEI
jgi:hypothetical protein